MDVDEESNEQCEEVILLAGNTLGAVCGAMDADSGDIVNSECKEAFVQFTRPNNYTLFKRRSKVQWRLFILTKASLFWDCIYPCYFKELNNPDHVFTDILTLWLCNLQQHICHFLVWSFLR